MTQPWEADRDLEPEQVRRTIAAQFPDLEATDVEWIGSGWDNDVYLIDGTWIFRFPRRREVAGRLKTETDVLATVGPLLSPAGVSVPRIERIGVGGPDFPYSFVGYRRLSGLPADAVALTELADDELAKGVARALTRLHSIEPRRLQHASVPTAEEGPADWLNEAVKVAGELVRREDAVGAKRVTWLRSGLSCPPAYSGEPRFLHNDFCPDHLLVDPDTGRLSGLLDFGDVRWGDPAFDFVVLPAWRGWQFTERVVDRYELSLDRRFWDRLRFLARVDVLVWLHDAHVCRADVEKHRRWVRNVFAEDS